MSVLDLTPAPGAAPTARRIVGHARTEVGLLLRNGEQLLLALVIPAGILLVGRFIAGPFGGLDTLAPSVLALAVWSSAFTSVAIATGFERRYGVLERLASTPLGRSGVVIGKAAATATVVLLQLVVLTVLALVLGWRPGWTPATVALALVSVLLASTAFAGAALLLAGRLRAEVTLGLANLVYVVLLALGGTVLAVARYPLALQPVIGLLPTAALGEGLRAYAQGVPLVWPVLSLAIWAALAVVAAWKGFRWVS